MVIVINHALNVIKVFKTPKMKTNIHQLSLTIIFIMFCFGCDTSIDLSELYPNLDLENICFSIKVVNSHQPIQGATLTLIDYYDPVCTSCPVDFDLVSDPDGEACATVFKGWTCASAVVSAEGYITKTFTGKPPETIYLAHIVN